MGRKKPEGSISKAFVGKRRKNEVYQSEEGRDWGKKKGKGGHQGTCQEQELWTGQEMTWVKGLTKRVFQRKNKGETEEKEKDVSKEKSHAGEKTRASLWRGQTHPSDRSARGKKLIKRRNNHLFLDRPRPNKRRTGRDGNGPTTIVSGKRKERGERQQQRTFEFAKWRCMTSLKKKRVELLILPSGGTQPIPGRFCCMENAGQKTTHLRL